MTKRLKGLGGGLRKPFIFPIFLKIVTLSLFFSLLSLFLYIATLYFPRGYLLEEMVYILIIIFGISLFAAGSIVEPLKRLKMGFSKLSQGESAYIEVRSGDELEELVDSFNKMVYELEIQRETIKKSEEKYRALLEDINDWVFEIDEDLKITYSSSRCREMIGKESDEILGRSILDFMELDMPAEGLKSEEQIRFDATLVGNKIVEVTGRPFSENGRRGFRCVARDITLRKKAEEEAAYLVSILEHSIDAIVSLDLDTKIVSWNKGAELMFGYKAEEMIGKPLSVLIPPERHEECAENFRRVLKEKYVRDIEAVRISKSGKVVIVDQTITGIVDSEGELIGYVVIMRDITERKRSQENLKMAYAELERKTRELEASKRELEYLANIVENSGDAIYSVTLDGEIVSWNRTAEKLFGWAKEEAIGMDSSKLLPDEIKNETEFVIQRIQEGERELRFETRRVRKDGEIIDVEVTVSPLFDGGLSGISLISRDITMKREAEREAERRMLKYEVERGRIYFADDFGLAVDVLNDLMKCGYTAKVITRRYPEAIGINKENHVMITDKRRGKTVSPDIESIYHEIVNLSGWRNAVLLDLDYLIIKHNFEEIYELLQKLKDLFFVLNKGILVVVSDSGLVGGRELKLLKMECGMIRSKEVELPSEMYELLRYIYSRNRLGDRPSIKDVMDSFNITRNTAKKRIKYLAEKGLVRVMKDGRARVLEVMEGGKELFRFLDGY